MLELFNPAGLSILEDREAAVAYGYVAPRVFYARFVGRLSESLGERYEKQLGCELRGESALAYFVDMSALSAPRSAARPRLSKLVRAERAKLASIVVLAPPRGAGTASRAFEEASSDLKLLRDPFEFERELCNVAPFPEPSAEDWEQGEADEMVWQVHSPR